MCASHDRDRDRFFSRVFLVPKRSGGWRLVIDLSVLNEFLVQRTFEMDTLVRVKQALRPGMWVTSLDLSDAYHHIPIKQPDQKFLCFQVGATRYMYMVPPFGLTTAPWAFTEVVKQIKKWTIPRRNVLFQYLDDWLNAHLDRDVLIRKMDALSVTLSPARLAGEGIEIRAGALAVDHLPWGTPGSSDGQGLPDPRENRGDPYVDWSNSSERRSIISAGRVAVRDVSSDNPNGSAGSLEPPATPTAGDTESAIRPSRCTANSGDGIIGGDPQVVDVRGGPADGIRLPSVSSRLDDIHGRLPRRLGSRIPKPIVARKVTTLRSSHQLAGVENSIDGHSTVAVPDQRPVRVKY